MRWHGRHMVIATAVAVAAAGNARADDLASPLGAPVLSKLTPALASLPPVPIPTPPPLPSLPPVSIPKPPPVPSLPSVPLPKPPTVPSLPAAPAPTVPQPGRAPAAVPRHAAGGAPARATSPTGGGTSRTTTARRAPSSGSSRAGGRASGTSVSRRGRSSARSAAARRRARRHEPSSRQLRRVLAPLAACVATLGRRQQRVLVRRAGLRGFKGASRVETAARLHLSVRRVARLEHRGLRTLRRKARAGACDAPAPAPAPAVAGTGVRQSLPAPAAPPADAPRQEVKAVQESGGESVNVLAESTPKLRNVAPVAGVEAAVGAGRSYAEEHPFQFALAVLVILMCALLFVREVRRG
jgi:hypothetical protein